MDFISVFIFARFIGVHPNTAKFFVLFENGDFKTLFKCIFCTNQTRWSGSNNGHIQYVRLFIVHRRCTYAAANAQQSQNNTLN